MTTEIRDIADLVRIVKEQPEWADTLRGVLLGQELLELPAKFNHFVEIQTDFNRQTLEIIQALADRAEEVDQRFDAVDENFRVVNRKVDNLTTRFDRMDSDFSRFRGNYAEYRTEKDASIIAAQLSRQKGLVKSQFEMIAIKSFQREELRQLVGSYVMNNLQTIPDNEWDSLVASDLTMRIETNDGRIYYIVVEASYTCDPRDTSDATRHAELLTLVTGRETYPAIAGVRIDNDIQPQIDSGEVFWYEIEDRDIRPDEPN